MNANLEIQEKSVSNFGIRKKIFEFEDFLRQHPNAKFGDNELCPLKHSFSYGMYVREIFIPKGMMLTGKIHKHAHPNFLLSGEVTVITENGGKERLKAPMSMISPAGTKRVVYTHTDTRWVTVHHNPENITDLKKLEDKIIAKGYSELESSNTNCGLESLKQLTSLKSATAKTLLELAKDNGTVLYAYQVSNDDELKSIPFPAIVHSENHFDYIGKKEDFDYEKNYTGYVFLTKKCDFRKIKKSELKKIKGETWVTVGVAAANIVKDAIKIGIQSATDCGKECRSLCRSKTGAFFGGRTECKQKCKTECLQRLSPEELAIQEMEAERKRKQQNTIYIASGILFSVALLIILYYVFRKK